MQTLNTRYIFVNISIKLLIIGKLSAIRPSSPHLVILWVEQFGQLIEDEARVGDRASEGVVDGRVEMVGGQYCIGRRKPRPHHQYRVRRLVELATRDGRLQLPERVTDERQGLALHAEPGRDVVGPRRQHHTVGQQ